MTRPGFSARSSSGDRPQPSSVPGRKFSINTSASAINWRASCWPSEAQTVDGQLTKIAKRVTDLEARIATETKSASRTLLDTEAEFVVPETLTKLEVELRITRASQAELERQRDAIQGQLAGLPDAVRKARDHFIHCRAAMAEIELHEQLMPVMNALARASAARRQINYHHDESRFPVEIPRDLIEAASDALAAEMPAA